METAGRPVSQPAGIEFLVNPFGFDRLAEPVRAQETIRFERKTDGRRISSLRLRTLWIHGRIGRISRSSADLNG